MGYRLGVDLGTTFTAAAVDDGTGPTMLGLGNRALTVPSVAFLAADGTFLFGEAADRRAATEPARSAREFKRRIGDTVPILLAGQPFSPQSLSAKLLSWAVSVATERQGAAPDEVVVTYPANWGGYKRELLDQLVSLADLSRSLTCTEPEAAATQYAARAALAAGDRVAVYDLGGGTFDVCVLEMKDTGFRIVGSPDGVEHLGGIDFDEAVFQHVVGMLADRVADLDLDDPDVTSGLARLRRECVDAKEALSSDVETTIAVALPGLTTSLRMTRTELEGLITSPLRDTLDATRRALRSADLTPADLATVVLVGGSSRIPLVSHLLQSEFGVRTAMDTHPKHDIALGAVRFHPTAPGEAAPAAAPTVATWPTRGKKSDEVPPDAPPVEGPDQPAPPSAAPAPGDPAQPQRPAGPPAWEPPDPAGPGSGAAADGPGGRRRALVAAGVAVALLIAGSAAAIALTGDDERASSPNPSPATSSSSGDRVYPPNVLLIAATKAPGTREVRAVTIDGEDLGPVTELIDSIDNPWVSRDGRFVGFRATAPGLAEEGPWTIMVRTADGPPQEFFTQPPERIVCEHRVIWHPVEQEVLIGCVDDADGDGVGDESVATVYHAPVDGDGRVDGTKLQPVLGVEDRTQTSPGGSPSSGLRGLSVLPSGEVLVSYIRGEEPGIHVAGSEGIRRVTSGEVDNDPTVSPSGLVAFTRDSDLYIAATDGTSPPCPASRVATPDEVTGVDLCNVTGDLTSVDRSVWDPAWSWDGTQIAFTIATGPEEGTLMVIDVEQPGTPRKVLAEAADLHGSAWGPR